MIQFVFVVTVTKDNNADDDDDDEEEEEEDRGGRASRAAQKVEREEMVKRINKKLQLFIESDAWGVIVVLLLQDGPFILVRLTCILYWSIGSYTMYFFTAKNALIIALQVNTFNVICYYSVVFIEVKVHIYAIKPYLKAVFYNADQY